MVNMNALRAKMASQGVVYFASELRKLLGVSPGAITNKTQGKSPFKPHEIKLIAETYQLTDEEIKIIFLS